MRETLTISLPPGTKKNLRRVARRRGVTTSDFARQAIQRALLLQTVEATRRKLVPRARAKGIYTDEDVFRMVS